MADDTRAALETAVAALRAGKETAGVEIGPEFRDFETAVFATRDGTAVRLFSTVHHDTDMFYEGDLATFDMTAATAELDDELERCKTAFDERFPE